jgi:2-keto-3-deoxy-L-rhamnonate aldolase RhmA
LDAARTLRDRIRTETPTTGLLVTNHLWPELVEVAVQAGVDYLIIDTEHGFFSQELICDVCALGRQLRFPILVRPVSHDLTIVRRALDMGPCGLLLPGIEAAEMLDQVRDAAYLPPRGKRRPGGPGNRWVSDYSYDSWKRDVEDDLIVLPQIETRRGLDHIEEIATHEITTAMAIGPYDLSADLGVCGRMSDPAVQTAVERIRSAGRAVGKNMWMIGHGPTLRAQGFSFMCIGEPTWLLQSALLRLVRETKAE